MREFELATGWLPRAIRHWLDFESDNPIALGHLARNLLDDPFEDYTEAEVLAELKRRMREKAEERRKL